MEVFILLLLLRENAAICSTFIFTVTFDPKNEFLLLQTQTPSIKNIFIQNFSLMIQVETLDPIFLNKQIKDLDMSD